MKRKTKMFLTAAAVVEIVALLLAAAYAWIESVNKPEIQGKNLSISASSGLLMRLNGNIQSQISLNEYLGEAATGSSFFMKECSSPDGVQMFVRDGKLEVQFGAEEGDIRMRSANKSDDNVRYIYETFELVSEGKARSVWLDGTQCSLALTSGDETLTAKPLRLSLTFTPEEGEAKTWVFAVSPAISMMESGPVSAINADTGEITGRAAYGESGLKLLSFTDITEANPFITLEEGASCTVDLRVWLEGTDEACVDAVAGNTFTLNLVFDSSANTSQPEA